MPKLNDIIVYILLTLGTIFTICFFISAIATKKEAPSKSNEAVQNILTTQVDSSNNDVQTNEVITVDEEYEVIYQPQDIIITPSDFVLAAEKYLGIPYLYGGTTEEGLDCSGLIFAAAQDCGMGTVEKTSRSLKQSTYNVSKDNLRIGDLVFFESDSTIFHVAIYIGENQILHSISDGPSTGVVISSLDENYWKEHFDSCGRFPIFMD